MKEKELQVFKEQKVLGKNFRMYGDIDNPLFLAKDVAEWIDYEISNVSKMVKNVDDDEKIITRTNNTSATFLTEDGLYEVLMQSRKPIAKNFKKEVKIILKTIRKTGGYVSNVDLLVNTYFGSLDTTHKELVKDLFQNIENQQKKIIQLTGENEVLISDILEWANTATINALVRKYAGSLNNDFATAWRNFKKELLYKYGINLNSRITAYLNETGKRTKPKTLDMLRGTEEITNALKTAIALCKDNNIEVYDILKKHIKDINLDDK